MISRKNLVIRAKVIDAIREFFKVKDFLEVETPLLVKCPGTEPYLEVFETKLKTPDLKDQRAFLLTSPEYAMKKLLASGSDNIFQICKSFRNNEGASEKHNPEFTILEWYRVEADYLDIMRDFEELMVFILNWIDSNRCGKTNQDIHVGVADLRPLQKDPESLPMSVGNLCTLQKDPGSLPTSVGNRILHELIYQNKQYNLTPPYPRISVSEAFEKYAGINQEELLNKNLLLKKAEDLGFEVNKETTWEQVYNQIFLNKIEPELAKLEMPVFIYDYPASQAALSKRKKSDPRFAERFEVYLAGLELGNAFSELTDWQEQEQRFKQELSLRDKLGKTKYELDQNFLKALKSGMPESGGIAVGVDRLVMLFSNASTIEEVIAFPATEIFD